MEISYRGWTDVERLLFVQLQWKERVGFSSCLTCIIIIIIPVFSFINFSSHILHNIFVYVHTTHTRQKFCMYHVFLSFFFFSSVVTVVGAGHPLTDR